MNGSVAIKVARWLPFAVMAIISLWVAAGVPHPRKPFVVNFDMSAAALTLSLAKVKHYQSTALFFVLGVVAIGARRASIPFWLAMGMGVAWELAEATAVRHTARLADLIPNLIAALGCVFVLRILCKVGASWRARVGSRVPTEAR